MRIAIAGGGIGGLTAALCLGRGGHDVVVVEKVGALGEVGAGIQVSPNAVRVLQAIGLGDAFDSVATYPARIVMRRWSDDTVLRTTDLGGDFVGRYGHRYANVHRADMIAILSDALDCMTQVEVVLSSDVSDVETGEDLARLRMADGRSVDADVIVGADGIHSVVRRRIADGTAPRFSGAMAYRALIPADRVAHVPVEVTNRMGPDMHVVTYYVGARRAHLNLVCVVPESTWDVESWTERGSVSALRESYEDWSPELQRILAAVDEPVFRWALHDREPLRRWGTGRATLLGDAAHPMLPFMAQGACQAIEDAAVLARHLAGIDGRPTAVHVDHALRSYEAERSPRTDAIQRQSFRNRDVYHLPDGDAQVARDRALTQRTGSLADLDWLYGHDPLTPSGPGTPDMGRSHPPA